MPKRKDDIGSSEILQLRMSPDLRNRCNAARQEGIHKEDAESSFIRFLIELGLNRYAKVLLPLEKGEDERSIEGRQVTIQNEQDRTIEVSAGSPVLNMGRYGDRKKVVGD
jgi:hypothetical protein